MSRGVAVQGGSPAVSEWVCFLIPTARVHLHVYTIGAPPSMGTLDEIKKQTHSLTAGLPP